MSVEEAILELLKVHNRVIVPGFGAFLVAKDDVDAKPYVLFNGFLSFNDGLLVDYLADKSGIDTIVSADNVSEYVYTVKHSLQEEKLYKFNLLGTFDFEESGSMRFRFNPNVGRTPQKPGAQVKPSAKKEEAKKVEIKKESKAVNNEDVAPAKVVAESNMESPAVESPKVDDQANLKDRMLELDKNNVSPDVIVEPEISSSKSERLPLTNSSFELDQDNGSKSVTPKTSEPKQKPAKVDDPESAMKKRRLVGALVVVIPLLLIAGYLFFSYLPNKRAEEVRKIAMENEAKKQSAIRLQADSIESIKVRELALADSLRIADESRAVLSTSGYHVIVGAFAEEANADKMVAKLKSTNFPMAQKIKSKNRFMVSVDASNDKEEAVKRLQKVTAASNLDCWLHHIK